MQIADLDQPNLQSTIYDLQSLKVAWLSLDAGDNDPICFLRYLIAALQMIAPTVGLTTLALLETPQPPALGALLTVLCNDLAASHNGQPDTHWVLVLEDYHLITAPSIDAALAFLLDHMPPQLHLIIASREKPWLPLARLRGRGQLVEIRASDLRFTLAESTVSLRETMGIALTDAEAAALEAHTEGWIVGLQLTALALRDRGDVAGFIRAFPASNRYVVDYLISEVFERMPAHLRTFVLQTAILDRLCGPLCDAMLELTPPEQGAREESGAYSKLILEQLERANLFLVSLDEEQRWYRYHHLFAEALAHRLEQTQPESVPILHARASAWYEAQGTPDEAIRHALAAQDVARTVRLLDQHAQTAIMQGEAATLLRWLDAIPEGQLRASPRLYIAAGWAHFIALNAGGHLERIEPALQDAERAIAEQSGLSSLERMQLLGEVHALGATIAIEQGDTARGLVLAQAALDRLGASKLFLRGSLSYSLGDSYRAGGDTGAAMEAFADARALGETSGSLVTALLASFELTEVLIEHGQLRQAAATCRAALSLVERHAGRDNHAIPLAGAARISLAKVLYEWNELAEARAQLEAGIELTRQPGGMGIARHGVLALAFVEQAQGHVDRARALVEEAEQLARASPRRDALGRLWPAKVRLWLAQGNLPAAHSWAEQSRYDPHRPPLYLEELAYGALARVELTRPTVDTLRQAEAFISSALAVAEAHGRRGHIIELLLLQALALYAQGNIEPALAAISRSLSLAEPEGYVRTFVDAGPALLPLLRTARAHGIASSYVTRLLDACVQKHPPDAVPRSLIYASTLAEPLTPRELEVLRLLAAGLSNAEIAERLIITIGTTKRHVLHIYGKLEVRSRAQAIVRARELGLLE